MCVGVQVFKMAKAEFDATIRTPHAHVDFLVDLGHPLLNRVVDGFVKVGGVGALHAASQDTYRFLLQGIVYLFLCFVFTNLLWCSSIIVSMLQICLMVVGQ